MSEKKIELTIVIVSFNTWEVLDKCIESVIKYTDKLSYEIVVVDNNSSDASPAKLKKKYPKVALVENKSNLGFGTANNQGAGLGVGNYLLFLNSDTCLKEDSLTKLIKVAQKKENLGILGCRLLNRDLSLQYSTGSFPNLLSVFAWMSFLDDLPFFKKNIKSFHFEYDSWYSSEQEPDWVTGALMLIPKKVFESIGGFDQQMFMYGEEVELAIRIKKSGYKVIYTPITSVVHLKGISSEKVDSSLSLISELKGVMYIAKKHYKNSYPLIWLSIKIGTILRFIIFGLIFNRARSRISYAKSFLQI